MLLSEEMLDWMIVHHEDEMRWCEEDEDVECARQVIDALVELKQMLLDKKFRPTPPEQTRLFDVQHESLSPERKKYNDSELIYAEEWRRLNERSPGLNGGVTYLEAILSPSTETTQRYSTSQRDAFVAASVVQWLGTNCGMAFLHECERKIAKERECRERAEKVARRLMGVAHRLMTSA